MVQTQQDSQRVMEECSGSRACQMCSLDVAMLQSRVETLRWQLVQAEESHQMYRSLMEQVLKFLERLCTNLDEMSSTEQCDSLPASVCNSPSHMVARCQSALSVDGSSPRSVARANRDVIPYVSRAKSTAQIEQSSSTFCDYTWRRSSKAARCDGVIAHKVYQETYRLMRTVKSLLNTSVPNLVQNAGGNGSCWETRCGALDKDEDFARLLPDADSSLQHSLQDFSLGETLPHSTPARKVTEKGGRAGPSDEPRFSSLRHDRRRRTPLICSTSMLTRDSHPDARPDSPAESRLAVSHYTASLGRSSKLKESKLTSLPPGECYVSDMPSEKQLSMSSNEDESGFSSMSSFQEVGLPLVAPGTSKTPSPEHSVMSHQEIGLPLFQPGEHVTNHRRWSSVPVETHDHASLQPESITVMWV